MGLGPHLTLRGLSKGPTEADLRTSGPQDVDGCRPTIGNHNVDHWIVPPCRDVRASQVTVELLRRCWIETTTVEWKGLLYAQSCNLSRHLSLEGRSGLERTTNTVLNNESVSEMLSLNRRLISLVCAVALISSLLSIWTILDSSLLDLKLDASRLLHRIVAPNVHVSDAQRFWTSPTTFGEATNVSTALLGGLPFGYKGPETLGIADRIYVLSLPRRVDRRRAMERLRQTLGLQWTYVDATDADTDSILNINAHIRSKRTEIEEKVANGVSDDTFQWPDASIVDTKARSGVPLGLADSDYWFLRPPLASVEGDSSAPLEDPGAAKILTPALDFAHPEVLVTPDAPNPHNPLPALVPLTCASKNYVTGPPFDASLPGYMLLTPAKIACWHSHLEVIQKVADGSAADDTRSGGIIGESQADAVTLVLEDDIDMERDIHARLREVWGLLPADWDIVFLGIF